MSPVRWVVERLRPPRERSQGGAAPRGVSAAPQLPLRNNEATSFRARPGCEITCERGVVLVTQEGDPDDHVLETGETLQVSKSGRVAAMALRDCRLRVPSSLAREIRRGLRSSP